MQSFITSETQGYTDKYDAALILANVSDFAQQGALRIKWSMPMGPEMPWYAAEVPTVFVSLNMPNHLIDVPMVKTAINAHNPTVETIKALVAKLIGRQRVHRHPQRQRLVRLLGHPPVISTARTVMEPATAGRGHPALRARCSTPTQPVKHLASVRIHEGVEIDLSCRHVHGYEVKDAVHDCGGGVAAFPAA